MQWPGGPILPQPHNLILSRSLPHGTLAAVEGDTSLYRLLPAGKIVAKECWLRSLVLTGPFLYLLKWPITVLPCSGWVGTPRFKPQSAATSTPYLREPCCSKLQTIVCRRILPSPGRVRCSDKKARDSWVTGSMALGEVSIPNVM